MQYFNPEKDIPNLQGKVIFVTGGNAGLGKQTILELSKHNPSRIFLGARNKAKALAAIEDIRNTVPSSAPVTHIEIDLSSFDSIKRAVYEFLSQSDQLHILINNAGILDSPARTTQEGYEVQFGTNHIGTALLTKLLIPTLRRTATSSSRPKDVRIINVASSEEARSPVQNTYDFGKLKTENTGTPVLVRYGISKLANIHHARALSRHYPEICSVSLHPGTVDTGLKNGIVVSNPLMKPLLPIVGFFSKKVTNGAKHQLWAAVSPDVISGEFYHPIGITGQGSKQSDDKALEDALWNWTEKELESHT